MRIRSLHSKFMLLFLIFFLVPFGLLAWVSIFMGKEMMKKSTMNHLQNLVEIKETAIEQWLKERVLDGKTITESREIKSLDRKQIEPFISMIRRFDPTYLGIWVMNLKGQVLSGTFSRNSFQREEWFQKALEQRVFILTPTFQPNSMKPALTISFSIKDAGDRPIGVLKTSLDLTYIANLISESRLGRTGEFFIVNPDGEFVLFKKSADLVKKGITKIPYFERVHPPPTYTGVYKDYTGNQALGSWKWIPSLRCYLIAEQDTKEAFLQIALLTKKAIGILVISALLILGISYWVVARVTSPIKRLSQAVTSLAEGHFTPTASTGREDEIGILVTGFNAMAEKLKRAYKDLEGKVAASNKELEIAYRILKERQEQLIQSEKMAALGQLSAGIAHEIRTPLTSIKIFVQSLEKEMELDENQREDFRIIRKEIERMNENISRVLNFARPEEPLFQRIRIAPLVKDAINLVAPKLKDAGIRVDISLSDGEVPLEGDPNQLTQVLLNLFLNAIEAMPQGGTLTVLANIQVIPNSSEASLQLVIRDTGQGVSEKDRPHIFAPFFTTKRGGTGLGLSIVSSIIQKHNGRIEVETESGKGSSFVLYLPVQKEGA
jgi:two-component system NtrC family sensor kinase